MTKASTGAAAARFMRSLSTKAETLSKMRKGIEALEQKQQRERDSHYAKISKLKAEVLAGLKLVGLSSVKLRNGDSFAKTKSIKFEIKNPFAFEQWAREKKYIRIDREIAKQRLQNLASKNQLPEWAVAIPGETISYRTKKAADKKKKS